MAGVRCARGPGPSFTESGLPFGAPIDKDKLTELDAKGWELYHVDTDFAENHNIAAENRAKLIEMIATWYVEAGKYDVLPVDSRGQLRMADPRPTDRSPLAPATPSIPGTQMVPANAGPNLMNRPYSITADVEIPKGAPKEFCSLPATSRAVFPSTCRMETSTTSTPTSAASSSTSNRTSRFPQGRHKLGFEFETTGKLDYKNGKGAPGRGQLYIDGKLVGQGDILSRCPSQSVWPGA